jgi:hypothetical protein
MVCGVLCVRGLFLGVWQSFDMCILTFFCTIWWIVFFFLFHDVMEVNEIWLQIERERKGRGKEHKRVRNGKIFVLVFFSFGGICFFYGEKRCEKKRE